MVFQKDNILWKSADHKGQKGWNKGLTKETNPSLLQQSQTLKKHWKEHPRPSTMLNKHHSLRTRKKMSLVRQGSGNANWKGGLTRIIRIIRNTKEYRWWQEKIKEKYGLICGRCGSIRNSQTHHIYPIASYPNKIFDLENGIILCKNCHRLEITKKLEPQWVHY